MSKQKDNKLNDALDGAPESENTGENTEQVIETEPVTEAVTIELKPESVKTPDPEQEVSEADASGINDRAEYSVTIIKANEHGLKEGAQLQISGSVVKSLLRKGNIDSFVEIKKK